jgi:hypothetical protein
MWLDALGFDVPADVLARALRRDSSKLVPYS